MLATMEMDVPSKAEHASEKCTCMAVRQAARHITQFYDKFLASVGLRTSQFQLLARLRLLGPTSINELAVSLGMDRTTLSRNVLPLEREGLIEIVQSREDRRSKLISLTRVGQERLRQSMKRWSLAQVRFAESFGKARNTQLRDLLHAASSTNLPSLAED
jgi:DNA-binding MarR family transcriptional regulator